MPTTKTVISSAAHTPSGVVWIVIPRIRSDLGAKKRMFNLANRSARAKGTITRSGPRVVKAVGNLDRVPNRFLVLESVMKGVRRSEEHTSELQSRLHLVCRLLLEKKK